MVVVIWKLEIQLPMQSVPITLNVVRLKPTLAFMVFNTTFNNILVISWQSVLLVRKPEYPENTTDFPQVTDKLYHINVVSSTPRHEWSSNSQLK